VVCKPQHMQPPPPTIRSSPWPLIDHHPYFERTPPTHLAHCGPLTTSLHHPLSSWPCSWISAAAKLAPPAVTFAKSNPYPPHQHTLEDHPDALCGIRSHKRVPGNPHLEGIIRSPQFTAPHPRTCHRDNPLNRCRQSQGCKVAKLFAKHFKVGEQLQALQASCTNIATGTLLAQNHSEGLWVAQNAQKVYVGLVALEAWRTSWPLAEVRDRHGHLYVAECMGYRQSRGIPCTCTCTQLTSTYKCSLVTLWVCEQWMWVF